MGVTSPHAITGGKQIWRRHARGQQVDKQAGRPRYLSAEGCSVISGNLPFSSQGLIYFQLSDALSLRTVFEADSLSLAFDGFLWNQRWTDTVKNFFPRNLQLKRLDTMRCENSHLCDEGGRRLDPLSSASSSLPSIRDAYFSARYTRSCWCENCR